ncbi:MAG: Ig-like domain-containing protein [Chloroflexi bacterium]|nr:Ig-like domain-containing protein [Chloroflexota bacterium]
MRNALAAALAVPVIALAVARSIDRRAGGRRLVAVFALLVIGTITAFVGTRPAPATGTPPTRVEPLDAAAFSTQIRTSESPSAPVTITFSGAMNTASVELMLRVVPARPVAISWDAEGTRLTVAPVSTWKPGTFYTVTVLEGALDATGRPLDRPVRAAFLTRPAVTATVSATALAAEEAAIATTFQIAFSGPIDESTLDVLISPAVDGTLTPADTSTAEAPVFEFRPDDPLQPDTAYAVTLAPGVRDLDGAEIVSTALEIRTAAAPAVVRFRPRQGWTDVAWRQDLSVRFTEPMDHASTEAAWSATQGTTKLAGTFRWAENDTVLVFDPTAVLGYNQKVELLVGAGAMSKAGVPITAAASITFTTAPRPVQSSSGGGSSGGGSSGGGSIGGSTWAAVESYYLGLMNCTRTGGWVTSTGSCSSPGGRNVAALWQDAGITAKVSRPYAKKLAVNGLCTHFSGGDPGDRLRAAGYTSYIWAENLGCRSGDPYAAVLGSHLFFQSEQSYNGGHYVNLMNAKYDRVGLGVWVSGGRVRLVVDFYHPL